MYNLANRGLATVDRRRRAWSAVETEAGRHFSRPWHLSAGRRPVGSRQGDTCDAEGTLTVEDLSESVRAVYRRAISDAITGDAVPEEFVLRYPAATAACCGSSSCRALKSWRALICRLQPFQHSHQILE
ncbi:hypothetical protein QYN14_26680 (plasmid) [Rhodococcus ruber]|uniref:hypothetical protein n=1 Tax=Rhodococcus ruber TaxID=1830 RepID=UPI0026584C07|nr:hypothetical protein [Rhodococcus ruber]WKK14881.1 hypothetical protein QYN14_26680 [Rhodococcus ruber]